MNKFVLFSLDETIRQDDGPQFWSNEDGWGDLSGATTFTFEETQAFKHLPLGGVWAELPPTPAPVLYEIQHLTVFQGWVNTWTVTDEHGQEVPETFATREAAQDALDDYLAETDAAAAAGDFLGYDRDDFRIAEVGA